MKKHLLVLGMIACVFGLTACGNKEAEEEVSVVDESGLTEANAIQTSDSFLSQIDTIVSEGTQDQYIEQDAELEPLFSQWASAMETLGNCKEIKNQKATIDGTVASIESTIVGTNKGSNGKPRTAIAVLTFDTTVGLTGLTVDVKPTVGESMERAALNTLLGMGTVFIILILISFLISGMVFIPAILAFFSKIGAFIKRIFKKDVQTPTEKAVNNTIAQIIENEESSDETEIAAVIAAAIAAYEAETGDGTGDGYVVRSIRKVNKSKWQNA